MKVSQMDNNIDSFKTQYDSDKALIRTNLATVGVSSQSSDSLTTLANKILDLRKINVVLTKTAGKNVLSYYDVAENTEYCTLTATVTSTEGTPLPNTTVIFKNGETTVSTQTTDNNGQASYTYTSTGAGDVIISANVGVNHDTYTIEDCLIYDPASNSNLSRYTTTYNTNATFGYDTTNEAYKFYRNVQGFGTVLLDLSFGKNIQMTCDVLSGTESSTNTQPRIGIYNKDTNKGVAMGSVYYIRDLYFNIYMNQNLQSEAESKAAQSCYRACADKWYHYDLSIKNGVITAKIGKDETLTVTNDVLSDNNNTFGICHCHTAGATLFVKNIKVKPL